jgi:DNA-binding NtrC family response regulator
LCEGTLLTADLLALEQASLGSSAPAGNDGATSIEDYFVRFVREHEDGMGEAELAEALGISRKSLWEKRHRLNLRRKR